MCVRLYKRMAITGDVNTPSSNASSLLVTLAQAQDYTSCAPLQHYISEHGDCDEILSSFSGYCAGIVCYRESSDHYEHMHFVVQRCEDPVTVDVLVELYDQDMDYYYEFFYLYNQSETVDIGQESYTGILERNTTHLEFMVSIM